METSVQFKICGRFNYKGEKRKERKNKFYSLTNKKPYSTVTRHQWYETVSHQISYFNNRLALPCVPINPEEIVFIRKLRTNILEQYYTYQEYNMIFMNQADGNKWVSCNIAPFPSSYLSSYLTRYYTKKIILQGI